MIRRWRREVVEYLGNPFCRTAEECRSIRDEVVFHLTESARTRVEAGASIDEACDTAMHKFGDVGAAVGNCERIVASGYLRMHRIHLALTAASLLAIAGLALLVSIRLGGERPGDGDILGGVFDEQSRPIENVHVLAVVKTWPQQAFRQQAYAAVTRSDGSFEITDVYPIEEKYEVQISVVGEGRLLQSKYINLRDGVLDPVRFTLHETNPLTVRIALSDGRPLKGVEVFPFERRDAEGDSHSVYFCSAGPIVRTSDARGEVQLPYFSAGDTASLYVRRPGGRWHTYALEIPDGPHKVQLVLTSSR